MEFIPGQRWVSNTESELGLGIVVENVSRRVEIVFPAAGETRTYAIDNAPLSRVQYPVGEQVRDAEGLEILVVERLEHEGRYIYIGNDAAGRIKKIDEVDLDSFVQFSKPQDRLFAGQIDKSSSFELRLQTLRHTQRLKQSPAQGLLGPRIQLLPHQLYIAHEVASRYAPRVLLADEVGLGKTIEAGMILHQQLLRGLASRVLIVVPSSLLHQWLVEMLRRFNLRFSILDEARCAESRASSLDPDIEVEHEPEQENPFDSEQLVLCSLDFLMQNPQRHQQALSVEWDLMVVDEAHHLRWTPEEASPAYQCIEALAARVKGLLLLTATPEQLGVDSHFARLRLLDPNRYFDVEQFREEESGYQAVSDLLSVLLDAQTEIDEEILNKIESYLGAEQAARLHADLEEKDRHEVVQSLVQALLDRHGTGRVLFRNTREAVQGFPDRQLHAYSLPTQDAYRQSEVEVTELLCPELGLGPGWLDIDPRVAWVVEWLAKYKTERVLLICAHAQTAKTLEEYLRVNKAVRSAVFHEQMTLVARDRAAAYFADDEESAQILVCSEIGSEGRNFQFAHHLILFDLPMNPDLLEQRIGRLDRIGQLQTVNIHVPYFENSAQEVLLRWYNEGLNAFEQVCAVGQSIAQKFAAELTQCMQSISDESAFDTLIEDTKAERIRAMVALQRGRDRLLELNSCNANKADEIIDQIFEVSDPRELIEYMELVFDYFGVEHQEHSAHSIVLHPGDHMLRQDFPGLREEGVTMTYQREKALLREELEYMTWEHPMVRESMEMVLNGGYGNTALCSFSLPPLKPGSLLIEAIFVVHCPAPKTLQLDRYIQQTTLRVVVNAEHDLTKILTAERMNKLAERVRTRQAHEIVRHARAQISALVKKAEQLADQKRSGVIRECIQAAELEQDKELERLIALAKVNPSIRKEEIDHQRERKALLFSYLENAQLKMDALRVALIT